MQYKYIRVYTCMIRFRVIGREVVEIKLKREIEREQGRRFRNATQVDTGDAMRVCISVVDMLLDCAE